MKRYKEISKSKNSLLGRVIQPNEKTIIEGKLVRPGDFVFHYKFGMGQITKIDLKTYSIPFIVFLPNKLNDEIFRSVDEFKQLTSNQLRQLHKSK
jgi:hypothetical protein